MHWDVYTALCGCQCVFLFSCLLVFLSNLIFVGCALDSLSLSLCMLLSQSVYEVIKIKSTNNSHM